MNRAILLLLFLCPAAWAQELPPTMQHIRELHEVLRRTGAIGFVAVARTNHLLFPSIPSRWHVENRPASDELQRETDRAARDFGLALAKELESVSMFVQSAPLGEELNHTSHGLCDLSDWCAAGGGYGNLFLSQRCLDMAAVGLARLASNLDFPVAECNQLSERLCPVWMGPAARARVLNAEAGTNLFAISEIQSDMDKTWGSGCILAGNRSLARQTGRFKSGKELSRLGVVETPGIAANLDFFERDDSLYAQTPTLVSLWESKNFVSIANGLELQNIRKAKALLRFRIEIGYFPNAPVFTEKQRREHDEAVVQAAQYGLKVSRMDEGMEPGAAGFWQAWNNRREKKRGEENLDATAWQAYNEVKTGTFLDEDARNAQKTLNVIKNDVRH